jgi:hypothetical protein
MERKEILKIVKPENSSLSYLIVKTNILETGRSVYSVWEEDERGSKDILQASFYTITLYETAEKKFKLFGRLGTRIKASDSQKEKDYLTFLNILKDYSSLFRPSFKEKVEIKEDSCELYIETF